MLTALEWLQTAFTRFLPKWHAFPSILLNEMPQAIVQLHTGQT